MNTKKYVLLTVGVMVVGLGYLGYQLFLPMEVKFFRMPPVRELIHSSPYYLDNDGWQFVMHGEYGGYHSVSFQKSDLDTLKHIIILLDSNDRPFRVHEYKKNFQVDDKLKYFVRMNSTDTLLAYFEKNSGDKFFVAGEYYYKFMSLNLDSGQRKYFMLYKDSLTRIRGNDLPELPNLNEKERRQLRAIFK